MSKYRVGRHVRGIIARNRRQWYIVGKHQAERRKLVSDTRNYLTRENRARKKRKEEERQYRDK